MILNSRCEHVSISSSFFTFVTFKRTYKMQLFSHEKLSAKAQRTTRTEIRTNLSFLVAQKRNRKKLFGCKMSNLATEKTKNGCFRLQFQLKLISATELIFFGFTFSFFRFECIGNRFSAKKNNQFCQFRFLFRFWQYVAQAGFLAALASF